MSFVAEEIDSQPETWRRAVELVAEPTSVDPRPYLAAGRAAMAEAVEELLLIVSGASGSV